jgi:hypothetical protein
MDIRMQALRTPSLEGDFPSLEISPLLSLQVFLKGAGYTRGIFFLLAKVEESRIQADSCQS